MPIVPGADYTLPRGTLHVVVVREFRSTMGETLGMDIQPYPVIAYRGFRRKTIPRPENLFQDTRWMKQVTFVLDNEQQVTLTRTFDSRRGKPRAFRTKGLPYGYYDHYYGQYIKVCLGSDEEWDEYERLRLEDLWENQS